MLLSLQLVNFKRLSPTRGGNVFPWCQLKHFSVNIVLYWACWCISWHILSWNAVLHTFLKKWEVCVCVCMHACMCVYTCVCVCTCVCLSVCVWTKRGGVHMCVCVCVCVCTYVRFGEGEDNFVCFYLSQWLVCAGCSHCQWWMTFHNTNIICFFFCCSGNEPVLYTGETFHLSNFVSYQWYAV